MNYEAFKKCILEYMQHKIGPDYEITIKSMLKNNHTSLDGICIRKNHQAASPIIYLGSFFERYQHGEALSVLMEEIMQIYYRGTHPLPYFSQPFYDFEHVSAKIIFRLINYKENEELLQSVPHRQFLDLAIMYCILVDCSEEGLATAIIYNRHLSIWQKSEEDLYQAALRNTPLLLPYRFRPLEDVIFELYQSGNEELMEKAPEPNIVLDSPYIPMYVLTNSFRLHGAVCLLYPHLLEQIAEQFCCDFFVLPSSVHELIFVPSTPSLTAVSLQEMVLSVNHTQLPPTDILSDSVYLYQARNHRLDII